MPLKTWAELKAQMVEPARQATTISVIAVLVSLTALMIVMGKVSNGNR